ncbi:MAG: shikimate dehydrogenase [Actinobacteria bacterium]|nr:shikimate dehydrogenase [Actinomycetota bacterium]
MRAEDAGPRRAAVLGHPVAHSLSPVLHLAAYAGLGLAWSYERYDVDEAGLPAFVEGLDGSWAGLSLTMPLKEVVRPLLDRVDPVAHLTGAVNTVVLGPEGRSGWNTDVEGVSVALDEQGAGTGPSAVLGGGATARSAAAALVQRGSSDVVVVARRPEAALPVAEVVERLGAAATVLPWDAAADVLGREVVVSTVPKGAADHLAPHVVPGAGCLLDVVYDPWPTPLAAAWAAAGGPVASGLDMLLHQAVRQVELMTGLRPDTERMRRALLAAAAAR